MYLNIVIITYFVASVMLSLLISDFIVDSYCKTCADCCEHTIQISIIIIITWIPESWFWNWSKITEGEKEYFWFTSAKQLHFGEISHRKQ